MIAIYARVSTEEQAKSGYSLDDQVRQCRRKAGTDNVKEYVDEGISGQYLDRPQLNKLRQDVKGGLITKVICYSPDRLSRDATNAGIVIKEIKRRGADIDFVNAYFEDTPVGRLSLGMILQIAEFEKATINERMSRGRKQKARQGKVVKNYQVYGYDYDKQKGQFVINGNEAKVVRMIFDLFTKPNSEVQGVNGIAKKMTSLGIPTKRNAAQWHKQTVNQILRHEVYIGQFYQNRFNTEGMLGNKFSDSDEKVRMTERPREEWIEIRCPAIIDKEQFDYAQKLLDESRRRYNGSERHQYLLSGLLRCSECGNTMTGRKAKNWNTYVYQYTDLKNLAGVKNPGCGHKVKCSDLDESVLEKVSAWLEAPKEFAVTLEDEDTTTFEQSELERVDKEIEKVKNGQRKLFNLLVTDDGLLEDDIREQLNELKSKELSLLDRKAELEEILSNYKQNEYTINLLHEINERYLANGKSLKALPLLEQREVIRLIVREIRVSKDCNATLLTF